MTFAVSVKLNEKTTNENKEIKFKKNIMKILA